MKGVTAGQMRRIDQQVREEFGIPEMILMEHAGAAVAQEARRLLLRRGGTALVLAGPGANGGDGFVAARHLDNWGIPVEVVLAAPPARIRAAAKVNLGILRRLGVPIRPADSLTRWVRWVRRGRRVRLAIDALLGTGVCGEVREPVRSMIAWLNELACPVVSVDLPSGLCADTGLACGVAVKATTTVACGLPKRGLLAAQGRRLRGRLVVADISLPRALRSFGWSP